MRILPTYSAKLPVILACFFLNCCVGDDGTASVPAMAQTSEAAAEMRRPALCIVTQYTENIAAYADVAAANHRDYASRHGYIALAYPSRISGDAFIAPERGAIDTVFGGGFYWQKLTALSHALALTDTYGQPVCEWAMWVDADIVFSNPHNRLETIIDHYAPEGAGKHVILSREQAGRQDVPINAGAIFVKNTVPGRHFLQNVANMYDDYKAHSMPEQDAITDYVFSLDEGAVRPPWQALAGSMHDEVAVASQRTFNAFVRSFKVDVEEARWQPCDFVAHISYGPVQDRLQRMQQVLSTASACTAPAPLPSP